MLYPALRASPLLASTIALAVACIASARETGMIALAAGAIGVVGDLLAFGLKTCVFEPLYRRSGQVSLPVLGRGPRPPGAKNCGIIPSSGRNQSYGLPSGHATHMWAMWSFLTVIILASPYATSCPGYLLLLISLLVAIVVSWSRVHLGCHTWTQVGWGALLGCWIGGTGAKKLESVIWQHG